ncbi:LIM domain-containing protein [Nitrososphaera viennensis]|uniref:LIM zinc-binding domain-containing protein n=1 Tax=Nitrososphaera viennensis EN76 TaxID=926571 RepID=A0A060HLT6_9ARCH|nr:LIM domain-containing protein [Nitrososphaera viennensis]AIC16180.1 hypothetical protein NVIE_019220 [Nitrososphaera viennensis EN76]
MPTNNCSVCGLKIAESSTGITVDDKWYHTSCVTALKCENCGALIGYLTNGRLEGRFLKTYCMACSKKF